MYVFIYLIIHFHSLPRSNDMEAKFSDHEIESMRRKATDCKPLMNTIPIPLVLIRNRLNKY